MPFEAADLINQSTAILSFLGGVLSFAAGIQIYYRIGFPPYSIQMYFLKRDLENAMRLNDKNLVIQIEELINLKKLNSGNQTHQSTSIGHLKELKNRDSFLSLCERLGNKRPMTEEIRSMLIHSLIHMCHGCLEENDSDETLTDSSKKDDA